MEIWALSMQHASYDEMEPRSTHSPVSDLNPTRLRAFLWIPTVIGSMPSPGVAILRRDVWIWTSDGERYGNFQAAQKAVAERPDLPHVRFVPTVEFWEPEVETLVNGDVWKGPDGVKFYNVGSERGYHYLGSARIYCRMGEAFGKGMVELLGK